MSEIEELIARLCPDGVEYRPLGEVGSFSHGGGPQKKNLQETGYGCIHYGQIYMRYGLFADKTFSFVSKEVFDSSRKAQPNDVIIADTSENDEDLGMCVAWIGSEEIAVSNHTLIFTSSLNPKYVAYFLSSEFFQRQKRPFITGVKVRTISETALSKIKIPVPPLEVQQEIVRILDKFTALEAELEAELEKRRQQYEYYRDALLTFPEFERERELTDLYGSYPSRSIASLLTRLVPNGVEFYELGEVASYSKSRIASEQLDATSFVGVDNLLTDKRGKTDSNYDPNAGSLTAYFPGDVLIGNIRPYLKKIWIADSAGGSSGDVLVLHLNEEFKAKFEPKFFYYTLSSDDFFFYDNQHAKSGKMPRGDKSAILKYKIPVPPLEVQEAIVEVLDKFDALVNDLTAGLPAEIAARRKQYEFYRDRLLTFPELDAA